MRPIQERLEDLEEKISKYMDLQVMARHKIRHFQRQVEHRRRKIAKLQREKARIIADNIQGGGYVK